MTEFKIGDRVRYLDMIPHEHENYYDEWRGRDVVGSVGTVVEDSDGYPVVLLDDENISYGQVVHPDNLEKI